MTSLMVGSHASFGKQLAKPVILLNACLEMRHDSRAGLLLSILCSRMASSNTAWIPSCLASARKAPREVHQPGWRIFQHVTYLGKCAITFCMTAPAWTTSTRIVAKSRRLQPRDRDSAPGWRSLPVLQPPYLKGLDINNQRSFFLLGLRVIMWLTVGDRFAILPP